MSEPAGSRLRGSASSEDALPATSPLLRRIAGDLAEERVRRVLAFGFLPGGLVFGLLAAPTLASQASHFPLWWNEAAFCGIVLPPVILGSLAFTAPMRVLRLLAAVGALAGLAAQASLPFVADPRIPLNGPPWLDQISALGTIAAVLAVRAPLTVLIALVTSALTFAGRVATDAGDATFDGLQNAAYMLLFMITFIALGVSALAAGRAADVAEADALRAATAAATDAARERERARINALVHDQVLATLLAAARSVPGSAAHERVDAQRALTGLQELLRSEPSVAAPLNGEELAWQVQAVTTELAPEAVFGYELVGDIEVPGEAVEALVGATEEAIRNSLRHASATNRAVHVQVDAVGVWVDVLDDGVGFDRSRVPVTRLGIAESIEGRMRTLPGGSAVVVSTEGVGTRVRIGWSHP